MYMCRVKLLHGRRGAAGGRGGRRRGKCSAQRKRENTNCSELQKLPSLINCTFCLINVTHEYKICKALSKFTLFKELH